MNVNREQISYVVRESFSRGAACELSSVCPVLSSGGDCLVKEGSLCSYDERRFKSLGVVCEVCGENEAIIEQRGKKKCLECAIAIA